MSEYTPPKVCTIHLLSNFGFSFSHRAENLLQERIDFPSFICTSRAPPPFFPQSRLLAICGSSGFTTRSVTGSVVLDGSRVVVERVALLF